MSAGPSSAGPRATAIPSLILASTGLTLVLLLVSRRVVFSEPRVVLLLAAAAATSALYRSTWGPLFVLGLTAFFLAPLEGNRLVVVPAGSDLQFSDLALAAALVAYVAGHYRYLRVRELAEPGKVKRRWIPFTFGNASSRELGNPTPATSSADEVDAVLRFVALLPLWPVVASMLMYGLIVVADLLSSVEFPLSLRYPIAAVWLLGGMVLVSIVVLRVLRLHRLTTQEAEMVLQETLANELRAELAMHARQARAIAARESKSGP